MARWLKKLMDFRSDERGNIALLFGLTLVPLAGAAGVAVDYGSASNMKTVLQTEVDATALEAVKVAVEIHTDSVHSRKPLAERQTLIDAAIVGVMDSRRSIAMSRSTLEGTGFSYVGEWADDLKTEYRVTATSQIRKLARVLSTESHVPVAAAATARMHHNAILKSVAPEMISPGYDAGDYNRIYAYCYNKNEPDVSKRRTNMTPVTSNGTYPSGPNQNRAEISVANVFNPVKMPECDLDKGETLSWRLFNVRGARTDPSRWPTDLYNSTTQLWTQTDPSGENTTGTPQQRSLFNYFSDTIVNASSGLESYQFNGDQLGYYAPITMMETAVCTTKDLCNPYKPGSQVAYGTNRVPGQATTKCTPGKFMYIGFEDRPYIPGRTASEYSTWGSGYWTDRDYEDVTFVVSCPTKEVVDWEKKISLIK
jgi:Flp pilus assembly protein TadG